MTMKKTFVREEFSKMQILILAGAILVCFFINRRELTEVEGWQQVLIYMGFNLLIMLTGQKLGSYKETLKRLYAIIDGEGSAELRLNEALHMLKMSANVAGIAFEEYNKYLPKKIREHQEKIATQEIK